MLATTLIPSDVFCGALSQNLGKSDSQRPIVGAQRWPFSPALCAIGPTEPERESHRAFHTYR
jgi:hypothetical protein